MQRHPGVSRRGPILVVEDDENDFVYLEALLEETPFSGISVVWARTLSEGLDLARSRNFAACFVDYQLGHDTGLTLIERLNESEVGAGPVIMLTGREDAVTAVKAMKSGAIDYLAKSQLSPRALNESLARALRDHRRREESQKQMRRLAGMAIRDTTTGLFRRHYILGRLEEEIVRSDQHQLPLCAALVEFETGTGEMPEKRLMAGLAESVRSALRPCDLAGHYHETAYLLLLPHTTRVGGHELLERLRQRVEQCLASFVETYCNLALAEYHECNGILRFLARLESALLGAKEQVSTAPSSIEAREPARSGGHSLETPLNPS